MTKAQEIRNRRLDKMQNDVIVQAEKVFDWMLDLIDANTKKGDFCPLEVCLFNGQSTIRTSDLGNEKDTQYELGDFLLQHDRLTLFSTLQRIVEKEDGFKAILKTNAFIYDTKCITFKIVIE